MAELGFYMPTEILFGEGALARAEKHLDKISRVVIVTGKNSAKLCGALDDVTRLLERRGIEYTQFDKVEENPKLSTCFEGGKLAHDFGAELIVGIGGGSPLDAAKAVAAFAADPTLEKLELFKRESVSVLPMILIPTTAGTGSEVNNYSVLTLDDEQIKKTFKSRNSYARAAVLDPRYTYSLPAGSTVSTALDAFCHCLESYLSPKSTDISMMLALYGAKKLWAALNALESDIAALERTNDTTVRTLRSELMAAACAGGIAINTTGTGFPHPLGYSLTLYSGVPHGRACACFTGEYIKYNMKNELGAKRLRTLAAALETTPEAIACKIPDIAQVKLKLTPDMQHEYIERVKGAANYANSPYVISYEEMTEIYSRLFV